MPKIFDRWAVGVRSNESTWLAVDVAQRAEELGFDSAWLAESYHWRSVMPMAAVMATRTDKIKIGLAVVPTHSRHPGLLAMEAATIDELSRGRFILGLGSSKTAAVKHVWRSSDLKATRETMAIVRGLIRGDDVSFEGEIYGTKGARMQFPVRPDLPIHIGCYAFSPKMLALSAELADGIIYTWPKANHVRQARDIVGDAAIKAGRDPATIDISSLVVIAVNDDAAKARAACKPTIAAYTQLIHDVWRKQGFCTDEDVEPVLAAYRSGGIQAATAATTDAYVEKLCYAGTPHEVRDKLQELADAGLKFPIAYGAHGVDPIESVTAIAQGLM
jgi:5,10-methylenetetrahydromethanopterin reductase